MSKNLVQRITEDKIVPLLRSKKIGHYDLVEFMFTLPKIASISWYLLTKDFEKEEILTLDDEVQWTLSDRVDSIDLLFKYIKNGYDNEKDTVNEEARDDAHNSVVRILTLYWDDKIVPVQPEEKVKKREIVVNGVKYFNLSDSGDLYLFLRDELAESENQEAYIEAEGEVGGIVKRVYSIINLDHVDHIIIGGAEKLDIEALDQVVDNNGFWQNQRISFVDISREQLHHAAVHALHYGIRNFGLYESDITNKQLRKVFEDQEFENTAVVCSHLFDNDTVDEREDAYNDLVRLAGKNGVVYLVMWRSPINQIGMNRKTLVRKIEAAYKYDLKHTIPEYLEKLKIEQDEVGLNLEVIQDHNGYYGDVIIYGEVLSDSITIEGELISSEDDVTLKKGSKILFMYSERVDDTSPTKNQNVETEFVAKKWYNLAMKLTGKTS